MKYPTEYKYASSDGGGGKSIKEFILPKYYYLSNNIIYKISSYGCTNCKCTIRLDEDDKFKDAISFECTYTYEGNDESKEKEFTTVMLLDYLIDLGDKITGTTIESFSCENSSSISLIDRLSELQKSEITDKLAKGISLETIYNNLPFYFKQTSGSYTFKTGKFKDYKVTNIPTKLNLSSLFSIQKDGSILPSESLKKEMKTKAENECMIVAANIMSLINTKVDKVTVTTVE